MLIRHATPDDVAAIAAVEAECFPVAEAATLEQVRDRVREYPNHFWLLFAGAVDDAGERVGDAEGERGDSGGAELVAFVNGLVTNEPDLADHMYADASLHDERGAWQMIFGVCTRPSHRCQGHAARLLEPAIQDAHDQGRRGLVLTCKDELVHYYARFGFVDEGLSASTHGNVAWHQMRLTF